MDIVKVLTDWVDANPDNFFAEYIKILAGIIDFVLSL